MKSCPQCNLRYPDESASCFVDGAALISLQDPRIGTTIAGRYVIEDVIGEGGMATVYRAKHKLIAQHCAVKIMNPALARDRVVRERFRREAKAAQKLAHPNIIEIFDHGDTEDGTAYLVMELLQGESLADRIARGPVAFQEAIPHFIQIARALARAHDFEVVHRDLKPENIFIARGPSGDPLLKLLDFGIARSMHDIRLTGIGEVFGTPQYMAPERITSIEGGPPADLYALGVIFFEMLTTHLPFDAQDIPSFFIKHLREAPPKLRTLLPEAPVALEELIDKLLAKAADQRPVDAHSVHADLEAICHQHGIAVPEEPQNAPSSIRQAAPTLPPVAIDRWMQRTHVFEQMLVHAFERGAPAELGALLDEVKLQVTQIANTRSEGMAAQRTLNDIEEREREGLQRFGFAMDALGIDASAAKQHVRSFGESLLALERECHSAAQVVQLSHREILQWEGRSAFVEPYAQLAAAYRTTASLIDDWLVKSQQKNALRAQLEDRERVIADLDFQIRELRSALGAFQQSISVEKTSRQTRISELGARADALEAELVQLATKLCAPLRDRPELAPYFKELEDAIVN